MEENREIMLEEEVLPLFLKSVDFLVDIGDLSFDFIL